MLCIGKIHNARTGRAGQALYLNVSDDLPSKKSSLRKIFGSNLSLKNKEIQFVPAAPYAALRAARQNFGEKNLVSICVSIYNSIRTHFTQNF